MSVYRDWRASLNPAVAALAVLIAGVTVTVGAPSVAGAEPSPVVAPSANMVTADALPTVQIDGVAWSQVIVGNKVYVGGRFTNARPAGAAPGTNLTPRNNLLAYNLTTGVLDTSFAPDLNGQVLSVAASPDGSRIYVAGDFTQANGQTRNRVAAYSTSTGQLVSSFAPSVNSQARAVVATNSTVYVGGGFLGSGSTLRGNLAAFSASNGAILNWNPNADYTVWALALSPDQSEVMVGGSFQNVGGVPSYGLAKVSASTGVVLPWNAQNTVRNAGQDSGVTSLTTRGSFVYGTTYHFGPGGNLEGSFKANVATGNVEWVTDCHGDTYSAYPDGNRVFVVGHPHYCGNIGGGHPQYSQWKFQHAMSWTDQATGTHLRDVYGGAYANWEGFPSPSIVNWLPDLAIGTFTGMGQAGWTVTGNGTYVVMGGEFPRANGVAQQGLVRFAPKPTAPAKQGPRFKGNQLLPTVLAASTSSVRVAWQAGYDRDDFALTYKVVRNGAFGSPVYTTSANSNWWTTPMLGFTDTGLTPGGTYSYQIVVNDSSGNVVYGSTANVTLPTSWSQTAHATRVIADGASSYWPMNEASGTDVLDRAGVTHAVAGTGVTRGVAGAVSGDTASSLNGAEPGRIYSKSIVKGPDVFTAQAWIKTSTTTGGYILGFGDLQQGNSGHRDRQIWMDNSGKIWFGVRNSATRTLTSPNSYRDNQWHQITASLGPNGMSLYVDGVRVGQRTPATSGEGYHGSWRIGGEQMGGWSGAPSNVNFTGAIDEVAIYPTALTQSQIVDQWVASGRTSLVPLPNVAPTSAFTSSSNGLVVNVDGSTSSDSDGTVQSYAWNFGDGGLATGATASHRYAAGGTYAVTLTVTDDDGATDTETKNVTVAAPAPNVAPTAAFTSTTSALVVDVDGSTSSDSDGTVQSYAWNFGDGGLATGATASHTYAAGGT
ncbi:MAG: PKD domain-containing protein, partial [Acidimicrobiia bacterium]|nr:PKD domain-containing protein [Acidimicrobiia bacterium]